MSADYERRCQVLASLAPKRPHRCPVCGGKGIVPQGFYATPGTSWLSNSTTPEQCHGCGGSGVVIA